MKTATIIRNPSDAKQTLGTLNCQGINFFCDTLELPDKNNQHDISCIPVTEPDKPYLVQWTRSARLSTEALYHWLLKNPGKKEEDCPPEIKNVFTYEITSVPNRAGIRMHSANYFFQLLGCVCQGSKPLDLNHDGELDLPDSRATVAAFAKAMNYEDFLLSITNSVV